MINDKWYIVALLLCTCFFACQQPHAIGKQSNPYKVGKIPNHSSFLTLNEEEQNYAAAMPEDNALSGASAFQTNRSRIFFDKVYKNALAEELDSAALKAISLPCNCYLQDDTLKIHTGIGMMGGFGFNIILYKNQFQSNFYLYTDDVKPYKSHLTDTAFQSYALVTMKEADFVVDKQPDFVVGEQLSGFIAFTTHNFYEQLHSEKPDARYIVGRLYFTCKTRKKLPWE